MEYKDRELLYYKQLEILFYRWTHEIEKSIWAGHIDTDKEKIDLCFNMTNDKAMEIYGMDSVLEEEAEAEAEAVKASFHQFLAERNIKMREDAGNSIDALNIEVKEEPKEPEAPKTIPMELSPAHSTLEPDLIIPEALQPILEHKSKEIQDSINDSLKTCGSVPIVKLALSSNIHNLLHKANIKTLDHLLSLNQTQIEKLLDFNPKNVFELMFDLDKIGIKHQFKLSKSLLQEILPYVTIKEPKAPKAPKYNPEFEFKDKPKAEPKIEPKIEPKPKSEPKIKPKPKFVKISGFEFSPRAHGRLKFAGIETLEELLSFTTQDLMNIQSFGPSHLEVIIDELDSLEIQHTFEMPKL